MTEKEKKQIIKLRESGMSYSEMAKKTGITVGGLKAFFSRQSRTQQVEIETQHCIFCGASLIKKQKTKPFKFCSPSCRHKWWIQNNEYISSCVTCGRKFKTKHKHQKYCCHACYITDRYGKAASGND